MIYHHCDPEGQPHISFFLMVLQMNNRLRLLGEQGCDWMGMVEHEEVCHYATLVALGAHPHIIYRYFQRTQKDGPCIATDLETAVSLLRGSASSHY